VQVLLTQVELEVVQVLKAKGRQPPRLLRMALVQATLLFTAHFYFFPPIEAGDNTNRFVAAVAGNAAAAGRAAAAAVGLA
jgi:hypothetical protein